MPWHIGTSDECNEDQFAVIKDSDGSVEGCHDTREQAEAQMAALYTSEGEMTETAAVYNITTDTVSIAPSVITTTNPDIVWTQTPLQEAETKSVDGDDLPASAFLVVEDPEEISTWHLPVKDANGDPDRRRMGAAKAALTVGHRGNVYEGPGKQEAIRKLKAMYEDEDMEWTESAVLTARNLIEQALSLLDKRTNPQNVGDSQLFETATGHVIAVEEAETPTKNLVPMTLDVVLIEPGPGNAQDGHFYPAEVLRRDAGVFKGAKMFATDHRQEDKNMGTWVSTVKSCPVGFTRTGGPIARVVVHKEWFAKDCRALQKEDLLDRMECSIIGTGKAKAGKVGETEYSIVESITEGGADWVTRAGAGGRALAIAESDTSGGENVTEKENEIEEVAEDAKTVTLREDDETEQPDVEAQDKEPEAEQDEELEAEDTEQEALSAESVNGLLAESGLGTDAIQMLAARPYQDEQEVQTAIGEMTAMIKRLTGSGQPFDQGRTSPVTAQARTPQEDIDAYRALKEKWGGRYEYRVEE